MSTLVGPLVEPGRPQTLVVDGITEYITVHDNYYRSTWKAFKRMLRAAHPDNPEYNTYQTRRTIRGKGEFLAIYRQFSSWKKKEAKWYEERGLTPPKWC